MDVNFLAISIGNTRTRLGTFVEGQLAHTQVLDNREQTGWGPALEQAYAPLKEADNPSVVIASVNPPLVEKVMQAVGATLGVKALRVEQDLPIPIGRQVDAQTLVGDDRLLNAAAAYDVVKQACVVVDAGTAITVDFVDGAGTFHGGAIGPGAQMMLSSLHEHTAQLPQVTLAAPREPIGHNTTEAMRTAVFHGLRGMVRELTEQYAEVAGAYPMVIATGGNAELLFKDYGLVERIVPDLTLWGIAVTVNAAVSDGAVEE